jgi:hypothetical protein
MVLLVIAAEERRFLIRRPHTRAEAREKEARWW